MQVKTALFGLWLLNASAALAHPRPGGPAGAGETAVEASETALFRREGSDSDDAVWPEVKENGGGEYEATIPFTPYIWVLTKKGEKEPRPDYDPQETAKIAYSYWERSAKEGGSRFGLDWPKSKPTFQMRFKTLKAGSDDISKIDKYNIMKTAFGIQGGTRAEKLEGKLYEGPVHDGKAVGELTMEVLDG